MLLSSIGIFLFTVLGVFLLNGRGMFLIAGFNTLPKEEKAKYDKLALSKFYGKTILALSVSMVFWLLSVVLEGRLEHRFLVRTMRAPVGAVHLRRLRGQALRKGIEAGVALAKSQKDDYGESGDDQHRDDNLARER